ISDGSTESAFISPLADIRTVTIPPPAVPSTSSWSSSACIASILLFSSAACFIRPRKSAMVVPSDTWVRAAAHVPAKACPALDAGWTPVRRQEHAPNPTRSIILADVVRPDLLGEHRGVVLDRRLGRHHVVLRRRRRRQHLLALAHRDDLRAGEARQHGLHQRVGLHAALELGAARLVLRPDGR